MSALRASVPNIPEGPVADPEEHPVHPEATMFGMAMNRLKMPHGAPSW